MDSFLDSVAVDSGPRPAKSQQSMRPPPTMADLRPLRQWRLAAEPKPGSAGGPLRPNAGGLIIEGRSLALPADDGHHAKRPRLPSLQRCPTLCRRVPRWPIATRSHGVTGRAQWSIAAVNAATTRLEFGTQAIAVPDVVLECASSAADRWSQPSPQTRSTREPPKDEYVGISR